MGWCWIAWNRIRFTNRTIGAWLAAIARNRATDHLRRTRDEVELPRNLPGGTPIAADALAREERLLAAEGIALADFARGGGEAEGTRRAARLRVTVALEPLEDGYRASFELPKGSYATVLVGELTKSEAEVPEEEG